MARLERASIARLLKPRSVAVVGASDKPGAWAPRCWAICCAGYAGAIYPVNPNRETIGERACLPSVDALPDGVDVAVLAIPAPSCWIRCAGLAARKVGAAIIFAAGFAEGGPEGLASRPKSPASPPDPAW
jgi:acyl-CoA synthetase (NDP forming)